MPAEIPSGAPHNRGEEFALFMGGAGSEPSGAPQNREEEWLLWLQENAGGGGADTFTVTLTDIEGTYTADKTYQEVLDAISAGKRIVWTDNGDAIPGITTTINYDDMSICATEVHYPQASEVNVTDYDAPRFQSFAVYAQIVYHSDGSITFTDADTPSTIVPAQKEVTIDYDNDLQQWAFQDPDMGYDKLLAWLNSYSGSDYTISPVIYLDLDDDVVRLYFTGGDPTGSGVIYLTGATYRNSLIQMHVVVIDSSGTIFVHSSVCGYDYVTLDLYNDYTDLYSDLMTLFQTWFTAAVQNPGTNVYQGATTVNSTAFLTAFNNTISEHKDVLVKLNIDANNHILLKPTEFSSGIVAMHMTGGNAVPGVGTYALGADIYIDVGNIFIMGSAFAMS